VNTDQLIAKLSHADPSVASSNPMMPWYRKMVKPSAKSLVTAKKAAVLVHIFRGDQGLEVLYMKRPDYDGTHGGQVSFPGGRREEEDANFQQTAIREAQEEVGLLPEDYRIIQAMEPLYIPPSNFLVHPFVSISEEKPELELDPKEVAYTFSVPLSELRAGALVSSAKVKTKLGRVKVPAYLWEDEVIWGATAIITARLVALLS
jgi:8-oxo-dGTP pyrophosphatase MutT (NUDIX family)